MLILASGNWVVNNLENAIDTWNSKLSEIWQIITQSPETFKGGTIWQVILKINGAVQAIGLALLVLFFVIGVVKTCSSLADVKKPEHAIKLFVRFAIAKGIVTYGLDLMLSIFKIVQGVMSTIMKSAGFGTVSKTILPQEIVKAVESCGFFESIPLWAVTLIGGLFVTVLSFIMILTAVCLEGAIIVLSCIIFSLFASSPPVVDTNAAAVTQVWKYIGELIFNMLVLVGTIKMSDRVVREMMGL